MAEYIFDVMSQTSKLDWAFPFQRTGAFPIDRSAVFSSFEDAEKYALGLDDNKLPRDERGLGGTSYVGQVISVYEAGEGDAAATVSAYIITPARGLMKLAATTASGDIAADVADLQGEVNTIVSNIESVQADVEKKADAAVVEEALAAKADASVVEEALAEKADAAVVEEALAGKADVTAVEEAIAPKADKTYVDEELSKMAVASEVETALADKADAEEVEAALELKANVADVDNALALKANAADVADSLALKANAADVYTKDEVYTKSEVETYIAGEIGSAGHLNREIVEVLPEVAEADVDTIYMVKKSGGLVDRDHYEEYMVINGAWEMIGDTFVDLSNYVDNDTLNTEIGVIEAAIDLKADAETVNAALELKADASALELTNVEVAKKADAETVNAALDLKANVADVNDALDLKANKSEVETALDLKADKSQVEQDIANAVAPLAIKSEMEAALALKANAAEVEAAMALKADKTEVEAVVKSLEDHEAAAAEAMALKADLSYVNDELAKKADKADTLAGYGIGDAYTKTEVDAALLLKASQQDHNELVDEVNKKANAADVYAKGETYSRQEIADLIADITGGESAADVKAELVAYKGTNDARVEAVEGRIGDVEERVLALENADDDNIIESIKIAGVALEVADKAVNIPVAGANAYGVVKTSDEIGLNDTGALEIKSMNVNKLTQNQGEWLILNGGSSVI